MRTDFKVYPRKIHVYRKANDLDPPHARWVYVWSANAYKTCRDAVAAAKALHPSQEFTARFAKD
jgi:hypothetical protein